MDERTSFSETNVVESRPDRPRTLRKVVSLILLICFVSAGVVAGFRLGRGGYEAPAWLPARIAEFPWR